MSSMISRNLYAQEIRSRYTVRSMDGRPEGGDLALTDKFRRDMVEAREARGWSQAELARQLGVRQPSISNIENGTRASSRLCLAISALLEIDPPFHVREEELREWLSAGARLLRSNPALFRATLRVIEASSPSNESEVENSTNDGDDSGKTTK